MTRVTDHLVVLPVLLPLVAAAAILLLGGEQRRNLKAALNLASTLALVAIAVAILLRADASPTGVAGVYRLGNWPVPFGIVLVVDRLSALMLLLTAVLALPAQVFALGRWHRAAPHFHSLFQFLLMGVNGAFLTGDLFNLFVFFEVMLAASYGLQLHGSGWPRVRSGLHYIAVNLLASSLFLVGLALLYGVMGTLSMADIALKLADVPRDDRGLLHAGMAILSLAFLIKAAIWPLNAWLVPAYLAASAPIAALFALMTKVGVYTLVRSWTLLFSGDAGPSTNFGQPVLLYGGLATLAFGTVGVMASSRLGRIASFAIIVSSGTLLAALGMGNASVTAAALYYLLTATLAVSALFLLVELVERIGSTAARRLRDADLEPGEDTNLDDEEIPLVGRAVPVSIVLLSLAFMVCALLVAGLPPLSGFLAKVFLLQALLGADAAGAPPVASTWWLFGLLLVSGFVATFALTRAGIRHLWRTGSAPQAPRLKVVEVASVVALIVACVLLTVYAEPVVRYTKATAAALHSPSSYIAAVASKKARPGPTQTTPRTERSP